MPGFKPSYCQNPFLCEAMLQINLIDTITMGIPRIFQMQRAGASAVDVRPQRPERRRGTIYGKSINESYSRLLPAGLSDQQKSKRVLRDVRRDGRRGGRRVRHAGARSGELCRRAGLTRPKVRAAKSRADARGAAGSRLCRFL